MIGRSLVILLILGGWIVACQSDGAVEAVEAPIETAQPDGFLPMVVSSDNPSTPAGIALGRRLFFDPILSANRMITCSSCHRPELAFTDGQALSNGIGQQQTRRSSPSLLNVGFHYKGLFWDGRSPDLEEQAVHPIVDPKEMGAQIPIVEARLRVQPGYFELFEAAFGLSSSEEINIMHVSRALAQFQRSLISSQSKFDRVMAGQEAFTTSEKRGWTIFFDADSPNTPAGECSHCHTDPLFTNLAYENNGLDRAPELAAFSDAGRGEVTGFPDENGKFKVPTLRNIGITAPYMHDGRFTTLEEVITHYNSGGHYAPNVSPNIRPLHLEEKDISDLIAFLHTLTDTTALYNKAYQSPL